MNYSVSARTISRCITRAHRFRGAAGFQGDFPRRFRAQSRSFSVTYPPQLARRTSVRPSTPLTLRTDDDDDRRRDDDDRPSRRDDDDRPPTT